MKMTEIKLGLSATLLAIGAMACGGPEDELLDQQQDEVCSAVDPARELMIRNLRVVEDPVRTRWTGATTSASDGAWHFGRLMANMAGDQDPAVFVRNWLANWENNRTINGQVVPSRTAIRDLVINPWPKRADGKLDLTRAPMRLLAIVSRLDLRNLAAGKAGEGRFVFGVLGPSGEQLPFTVILEYNLIGSTQAELTRWANDWHNLGTLPAGSSEYRAALQRVTDRFARKNAAPGRRNGSAISQVRTNEIALSFPWELREFTLGAPAAGTTISRLVEVTVAQTPANNINNTAKFARWVNANEANILAGRHVVPLSFESAPFRAAASLNNIDFWAAPGIRSNDARHLVSLNTCNGCHGAETSTGFLQINTREAGQVATLSGFLTGITVQDPVDPAKSRTFNDLRRRARDLNNLVCATQTAAAPAEEGPDLEARVH